MLKDRLLKYIDYKNITKSFFEKSIGAGNGYLKNVNNLGSDKLEDIITHYPDLNIEWLITGKGAMLKELPEMEDEKQLKVADIETRPRVPMDAAAGSLSIATDGVRMKDMEQIPVIKAFSKYDFTIFARGDSMENEIHSGDELACLLIRNATFIQWGRMHVLDTSQGIIVKKIFDKDEYILCRSEESELYPDFMIHKSEIHNIALVIGLVRRY